MHTFLDISSCLSLKGNQEGENGSSTIKYEPPGQHPRAVKIRYGQQLTIATNVKFFMCILTQDS